MQIKTQHKNYILAVCWYSKNWGKKQQKFWRNNVHLLCKKLLFMCCTGKESEKQILVKRWIFAEKFLPWKPILRYVVDLTSYLNENELYRVLFVLEFYTYHDSETVWTVNSCSWSCWCFQAYLSKLFLE